jgi:hypothetical protein
MVSFDFFRITRIVDPLLVDIVEDADGLLSVFEVTASPPSVGRVLCVSLLGSGGGVSMKSVSSCTTTGGRTGGVAVALVLVSGFVSVLAAAGAVDPFVALVELLRLEDLDVVDVLVTLLGTSGTLGSAFVGVLLVTADFVEVVDRTDA